MKKELLYFKLKEYLPIIILFFGIGFISNSFAYVIPQAANAEHEASSYIKYKGRVIDNETKKPLAFVDITVNTANISTITNREGKFSIKIPNALSKEKISISFLGYETRELQISELNLKNNIVSLNPSLTILREIKINAPKNAEALVKAAFNGKSVNYIDERSIMTGFYRETIKKGRKNASLTEAVVKIFKQPYRSSKNDNVELIKSRKSTDYSRLDTLAVKLQGGPYNTLYSDIVKYPEYVFNEHTFPYYEFSFAESSQMNDRKVYVVDFKQHSHIVTPFYHGKLFIDAETFALVSGIYQLNVKNKYETTNLFLRKKPRQVKVEPLEALYRVDYKTKNGKTYYSYSNIKLTLKVKWRKKLFSSTYTLDIEMAITDWKENLIAKINKEKRIKPTVILSDEASGFSDPAFWGAYNIIEPEKSIESAIKKISKQLSRIKTKK